MSLEQLKREVVKAGYTVSAASWESENHAYAFSKESAKGTYGHPKFTAHYAKHSGWANIGGKEVKVS